MSAPELPPIADRERHRPPSRSTSKSSLNQLTAAVSNKVYYARLTTTGSNLPRNHSDSSLKGLLMGSSPSQGHHQHNSGSLNSYPTGGGGGGGGDVGLVPAHLLHRSSSRALSWCATDNSAGSIPRLETLFERKNLPQMMMSSSSTPVGGGSSTTLNVFTARDTPPPPIQTPSQILKPNNNNNVKAPNNNAGGHPRSVSVNGIRRSDSQELSKVKAGRRKRLQSECDAGEIEPLATVEQCGRLSKVNGGGGMRRSQSDNKLVEKKKNVRNARLNSSRHISVNRVDKLTNRKSRGLGGASTFSVSKGGGGGGGGMRRVSSVSAINNLSITNRTRIDSNQDSENVEAREGGSEDSEEEEDRVDRIREWLLGLDCADAPPDPVIEYADDPPQTDTALHIVYKDGES